MKLSIIMPVYNEAGTLEEILRRVFAVAYEKEVILVDDGSTDGTRELYPSLRERYGDVLQVFYHERNSGKGAAIRTALAHVTGDLVLIQDGDLEYDPQDYHKIIKPIEDGKAQVVYGSRFTGERRNMFFHHWVGNWVLTLMTNILYNTTLSDMETCYKVWKTDIIAGIPIRSNRFNFEPEITAKVLKRRIRIYEVPISYAGREYEEGKKITWKDGFSAMWALVRYRFFN